MPDTNIVRRSIRAAELATGDRRRRYGWNGACEHGVEAHVYCPECRDWERRYKEVE